MKLSAILNEYEEINPKKVKLVRHASDELREICEKGFFEDYQCEQGKNVFDKCEYILSFIATEKTYCRFIGCYKVGEKCSGKDKLSKMPSGFPYPDFFNEGVYYNMTLTNIMAEYKNRLVIEWGKNPQAWHQWAYNDKEIIALYPKTNFREVKPFSTYEDVILSYDELVSITQDSLIYNDWKSALSNVNGIYLILDKETGNQYIGSTYNQDGIFGRWKNYADTKDGGDIRLKDLLKSRSEAYKDFQFTILRVLSKCITPEEAINIESLYKEKLGTRVHGLNMN